MRKLIKITAILAVLGFVAYTWVTSPGTAGSVVSGTFSGLGVAASQILLFIESISVPNVEIHTR